MARLAYLLFNVAVSTSVFAVVWLPGFWRKWRGMAWGLLAVSVPFAVWDVMAARAGHWAFNPAYTLSFRVAGLPLEEILFFVTVPLACMVVWELLGRAPDRSLMSERLVRWLWCCVAGALLVAAILAWGRAYTQLALVAAGLTALVLTHAAALSGSRRFVVFQLWGLGLFVVCNSYLTALPIVMYGRGAILGARIGTIPVEDFLYNFALINLFLVVFTHGMGRKGQK